MLKAVKLVLLCLGLALAAWLLYEHAAGIQESLRQVGWGFLWYMAASFLIYALDTWGWRLSFVAGQPDVGFGRLFSVRMAGEAVNKVTPLASMGGEPLKAYLLTRRGTGLADALASVAIAKNTMTLAQIAFVFLGIALAFRLVPGREGVLAGFAIFPGAIAAAILVTAVLDWRLRRRGAAPWSAEGEPAGFARRKMGVVEMWSRIADYYRANPRAFLLAFVLFFLGWGAGALELLAAAHALGFPLSFRDALAMEGLLVSINMATFFIPANAGSQEGGFAYLATLLGLSTPHGLALAVLRRCRDVLWVAFGLGYLAVTEGRILFRPRLDATESPA